MVNDNRPALAIKLESSLRLIDKKSIPINIECYNRMVKDLLELDPNNKYLDESIKEDHASN